MTHPSSFSVPWDTLHFCLRDILSLIKPSEEDRARRLHIINELEALVGSVESLRGATVRPFGSFISNLYTRWGDLDISIELPHNSYAPSNGKDHKKNLLRDIMRALQRKGWAYQFQFIPNARVPLLKFKSSNNSISCDISIDNPLGQIKSKFLLWITEMDERFCDMVLLIKEWAKAQNINDPKYGTLNSYSLCLMVIFHFQTCMPAILPPLKDIYEGNIADYLTGMSFNAEKRIQDTCAANIARFRSQGFGKVNQSSLSELLISFFEKFSGIKSMSAEHAICTYTGRLEKIRSNLKWMGRTHQILIEDPFEQPDNAARAVRMRELSRISQVFKETHRKFSTRTGLLDRNSLITILVRPQISSQLGARMGQVRRHSQDVSEITTIQDRFQHVMRLENYPSSSAVSLQRPRPPVRMQVRQVWKPRYSD